MAQFFGEDLCALKDNPSITGLVTCTWHDVAPARIDIKRGFFVHRELPAHLKVQVESTHQVPRGYVILGVGEPDAVQLLVSENNLVLIDRQFSRGDVVKRNPVDPQSGTVISSSTVCTLQPSFGIFTDGHGSPSRMYFAKFGGPPISPVDMHDLTRIQPHNLGDLVIYRGWLGVIKRTYEQVTVKFDGGGVAIIGDPDYLEEKGIRLPALLNRVYTEFGRHPHENPDREIKIPAQPGYHGQKVRIPRKVLSKSHWLVGSYNRQMKPEGVVLNIICALVEVDWKLPKVGESNLVKPTKPAQFLDLDVLHSGNIKVYDRSRCPEQAHRIESPNLTIPPWSLSAGDHVKFKDARVAESKYGYSLAGNRQQTIFSVPWTQNALQALMAQVTSTTGEVKVRWQDNSVTQEVSSNLCPYDEVDDHDVWPGEIVSRKDQEYSYDDFTYEVFIRTRAVGVVQSVNAAERVALVRWFDRADITITGEDHDKIVRLHSKLGKITENITEVSVYEVIAHRAITRRRGDIVRITSPEVFCPQHTGHKNTTPSNAQNALFAQGEDGWYGEVVELLLDGQLLVRLGGLENVRDVTCSVLDVDVIESADDDTTESSTGSTDTDMSDGEGGKSRPSLISGSTGNIAETVIEYDGSSPSNADSCHEDQWTTDSDSDVPMKTDKLPSQESQTKSTDETNGQDGDNAGHFIDPLPLNRSKKTQAGASTADATAPTTVPGPASFDILDGPCPEHTFGAPLSGSGKWLKAVLREHQILRSALPEGVFVRAWESSMELMRVLIIGPSGTPYALAPFLFDIHLGEKFPYQAPGVFFHSWTNGIGKVNPNLYEDGKVCLSLLGTWSSEKDNEEWIPFESSILQVIVSLLGLVLVKEPFYNEAGYEALQGTAKSKHTSALYSEKAFVLSRNFVAQAIETLPEGFEDITRWLYLASASGPSMLQIVIEDCNLFLQGDTTDISEQASTTLRDRLDKYCIMSPKLSRGALVLLKKFMPGLEYMLNDFDKSASTGRKRQIGDEQQFEE